MTKKVKSHNEEISRAIDVILQRAEKPRFYIKENPHADWLLSGNIGSSVWVTRDGGKEELVDGNWRKTVDVDFDATMSDGTSLCSPENQRILEAIQVWAYALRSHGLGSSLGPRRWSETVQWGINAASWMLLHNEVFRPKEVAFRYFNKDAARQLLAELALGSWCEALQFIPRLLVHLYYKSFGEAPGREIIDSPFGLPSDVVVKIIEYIKLNDLYSLGNRKHSGRLVSRGYLVKVLGGSTTSFSNNRFRAFMRQFEPGLSHPHLLLTNVIDTVYPSQNTPLLKDFINNNSSEGSLTVHADRLRSLVSGKDVLPEMFCCEDFDVEAIRAGLIDGVRRSEHHNLIPLSTGLAVLNEVVTWVFSYGEAIVDAAIYIVSEYEKIRNGSYDDRERDIKRSLAVRHAICRSRILMPDGSKGETLKKKFGIMDSNKRTKRENIYIGPSFYLVLQSLIGACTLAIAIMKPSRDKEISSLERDCLKRDEGISNGFWLEYSLGKSGQLGLNVLDEKPIPFLTAKAIAVLQRLGCELVEIYSEKTTHANSLFYFPSGTGFQRPLDGNLSERINACIDVFCDFVETPVDEYGRRWYVRFHELRKFFLIMLFWHGKYHVLDAVRWVAGHTQADHTYAYIEANVPGEEITRIEAEYVDEKLIMLERNSVGREGNLGLAALYDCVCSHFNVNSIEGVRGDEYFNYLADLRAADTYSLKPYSVFTEGDTGEVCGLEIAVKFMDISDEKYNG